MTGWCDGIAPAGWMAVGIGWVLFLAVTLAVVMRLFPGAVPGERRHVPTPQEVLDARLSRGELDPRDYRVLRDELVRDHPANP